MHALVASDSHFVRHTAATIASVLSSNPGTTFHWIHDHLPANVKRRLCEFTSRSGSKIYFYEAISSLCGFKVDKHASSANYFRLQALQLLPETIDRILYLDSDVIVRKNLADLFAIDLNGCLLAAAQDPLSPILAPQLGLQPCDYFNSGVMLIPLNVWREKNIDALLFDYIVRNNDSLEYWDQDALNHVIAGRWSRLSYSFNAQSELYRDPSFCASYSSIISDPHIVHFSGSIKPWHKSLQHPLKIEYWKNRRQTPWPYKFEYWKNISLVDYGKTIVRTAMRCIDHKFGPANWLTGAIKATPQYKRRELCRAKAAAERERNKEALKEAWEARTAELYCTSLNGNSKVRTGPFKGMIYLNHAQGSQLLPKIAGTYEQPLQDLIKNWAESTSIMRFINIGCAEGYYAVGLALTCPHSTVYAFDTSGESRESCQKLASVNNVATRVEIFGSCSHRALNALAGKGAVVICDIEGGEVDLLDPARSPALLRSELLVETHDFLIPNASEMLIERFCRSHKIVVYVDCQREARELLQALRAEGIELEDRSCHEIMNEQRPPGMRWLHLIPNLADERE